MNFTLADFVDCLQQRVYIDADFTFGRIAVLFRGFHPHTSQPLRIPGERIKTSDAHHLSIDRRENPQSHAPDAATKRNLFYTGTKPQEENDEGE
ncbi:hypothetical protein FDK33_10065 [Citrobacter werkmanii]|nr:hypothetical protein [Citrobacter werkmanii]TKU27007.1 hypothetical protein FDX09_20370 [Citrobacter sp. wls717]TKU83138.1 hypothetical protein FDX13_12665 [Citrobacter sp. wls707]MBQ4934362.1 hypothetical protein [Citrobacter werkmanii]MBQ4948909.1 hypothetical protein [Citrobacter werkmanii]